MLLTDIELAAAALPGPITNIDEDRWMWASYGWLHSGIASDATSGITGDSSETVDVDCKAMRVWEENFTLSLLVENLNHTVTASTINAAFTGRVLLKLA
jgi:hypothetical protein